MTESTGSEKKSAKRSKPTAVVPRDLQLEGECNKLVVALWTSFAKSMIEFGHSLPDPVPVEFEARFGKYNEEKQSFVSGMEKTWFFEVLEAMKENVEDASHHRDWSQSIIQYYEGSIRRNITEEGAPYETSKRLMKVDFPQMQEESPCYDLRLAVKNEQILLDQDETKLKPVNFRAKKVYTLLFEQWGFKIDFIQATTVKNLERLKLLEELDEGDETLEKYRSYELEIEVMSEGGLKRFDKVKFASVLQACAGFEEFFSGMRPVVV